MKDPGIGHRSTHRSPWWRPGCGSASSQTAPAQHRGTCAGSSGAPGVRTSPRWPAGRSAPGSTAAPFRWQVGRLVGGRARGRGGAEREALQWEGKRRRVHQDDWQSNCQMIAS